jgi:hypothetical protein
MGASPVRRGLNCPGSPIGQAEIHVCPLVTFCLFGRLGAFCDGGDG